MGKVLIDGDIIAYRAAFSTEQMGAKDTEAKVDALIDFNVVFQYLRKQYSLV